MLTGRFTYGIGRLGRLGQTEPVDTTIYAPTMSPLGLSVSESSLAQMAPAQWGLGEWAVIGAGILVLYSVTSTTKRGVRGVADWRTRRRKKLAEQHESYAKGYRA
jgi:hypothetical protein